MNKFLLALGLLVALSACATLPTPVATTGRTASAPGTPRATFTPLASEQPQAGPGTPTPGIGTPSLPRAFGATPSVSTPAITVPPSQAASTSGVTATPALPQIYAFGLEPPEVAPGGRVYLTWDAHGDYAFICPSTYLGSIDHLCFDVALKGAQYVTIYADERAWDYRGFELHVWQADVEEVAFLPIRVTCQGGGQWWFFKDEPYTTNIPAVCPVNPAVISDGAAQRFEGGLMLWIEAAGRVVVLYHNGRYETFGALICDSPPAATPPSPPPGRFAPTGGFAALWYGYCQGTDHLRAALGWATAPEFFTRSAYQCYEESGQLTCFVRGPEVQIYRLKPDGTWDLWTAT